MSNPVIDEDGDKFWYQNGIRHRVDGPAVEYADGTKHWYQNGQLHRVDGPAIERANGDKFWCQNGKYHRTDGPAVEHTDGYKSWFVNDKRISFPKEFQEATGVSDEDMCVLILKYGVK